MTQLADAKTAMRTKISYDQYDQYDDDHLDSADMKGVHILKA